MREETATIETNVHLLAHIATDLREIAAQIDELAIETASANQEEPIALPEKTEPTPERAVNQRLRYANGRRVQPTGPRFGGNAVRPGMGPRFAGGVNPLMGLFGGMAGGLGGGLGSLLGGGAGGMNPLLGLLGGAAGHTGAGTPGNVNPLASLLGGGGLGEMCIRDSHRTT